MKVLVITASGSEPGRTLRRRRSLRAKTLLGGAPSLGTAFSGQAVPMENQGTRATSPSGPRHSAF